MQIKTLQIHIKIFTLTLYIFIFIYLHLNIIHFKRQRKSFIYFKSNNINASYQIVTNKYTSVNIVFSIFYEQNCILNQIKRYNKKIIKHWFSTTYYIILYCEYIYIYNRKGY